jgi:membrane protein
MQSGGGAGQGRATALSRALGRQTNRGRARCATGEVDVTRETASSEPDDPASRLRRTGAGAIARRVARESFTDRTFMVAAGLSFFGMFSLFPALAVAGLAFKRIVDPAALEGGVQDDASLFPEGTPALLVEFLTVVPASLFAGLGLSLNLLIVLYTVQRAASGMITALNIVYEEDERRGRGRREVVALLIAVGALILLFAALFLLAVLPIIAGLEGQEAAAALRALRWPILMALFFSALALLYRHAACRDGADWATILAAAAATTVLWAAASALFTLYMNNAGGWEPSYGSITTPIVLMMWIFISAFVIMIGAEFNAQLDAARHPERRSDGGKAALDRREGV